MGFVVNANQIKEAAVQAALRGDVKKFEALMRYYRFVTGKIN